MSPRDKRSLRILRRDFVRAAASGPLLWLGAQVRADDAAPGSASAVGTDPALCGSGVPLPELQRGIGLRLRDAMAGELGGARFAYEIELEIADLAAFLSAADPRAEVVSGVVHWAGSVAAARVRGGSLRAFAQCDPTGGYKRFELAFEFQDGSGRTLELRGEKRLDQARGYDPATDLSYMSATLQRGASPVAAGQLRAERGELLTRLHAVEVEGTLDRAQIEAARRAYLEHFNRQCAGCYPQLPKLLPRDGTLTPEEWRALSLVVRVMLPMPLPEDGPSVDDAIENLERFLHYADPETFAALRAQVQQLGAIAPLASGHVVELKHFVRSQLKQPGRSELKAVLDSLHKLAVLGYYSHGKSYRKLAYTPLPVVPLRRTLLPVRSRPSARIFDVAIVGSGVAGSLLAERLTAAGKSVVVLESGPYVPEMTIDADELRWLARLERGSGLQQANGGRSLARVGPVFPILQGHCVGGGGLINNAVVFQISARRLEEWRGVGFPVAPEALRAGYAASASELQIGPVSDATRHGNPSFELFANSFGPVQRPSISELPKPGYYECLTNLAPGECLGCGMCNTGCGSERKMNGLQVYLPRALERDCELIANAEVVEVLVARKVAGVPGRAIGLRVRTRADQDGRYGGRQDTFTVRARQYVLSAGAIHSARLLLRSPGITGRAGTPIGERLSVNVASPVLGFVAREMHTRPSLQLTRYYIPPDPDAGFLIEDLYNPPGQAALVMPGYGLEHYLRMHRYKRTVLLGAVVPTAASGRVTLDEHGAARIEMPLGAHELTRMRRALTQIAEGMLRADEPLRPSEVIAGAEAGGFVMRSPEAAADFARWLRSFDQLALSTGHPQGGTCMSEDPTIGVVDPEFRLRGFSNLRVCDAGLFPMSAGTHPQWTVMALAHCCANLLNGRSG